MVHTLLYNYLGMNSLIHDAQSGFHPLCSTQAVLIRSVDDWRRGLDQDKITGTIMVDVSKAFDSINHQLLLEKKWSLRSDWEGKAVVYGVAAFLVGSSKWPSMVWNPPGMMLSWGFCKVYPGTSTLHGICEQYDRSPDNLICELVCWRYNDQLFA